MPGPKGLPITHISAHPVKGSERWQAATFQELPRLRFGTEATIEGIWTYLRTEYGHNQSEVEKFIVGMERAREFVFSLLNEGGVSVSGREPVLSCSGVFEKSDLGTLFLSGRLPFRRNATVNVLEKCFNLPNLGVNIGQTIGKQAYPILVAPNSAELLYFNELSNRVGFLMPYENGERFPKRTLRFIAGPTQLERILDVSAVAIQANQIISADNLLPVMLADIARSNGHILKEPTDYRKFEEPQMDWDPKLL